MPNECLLSHFQVDILQQQIMTSVDVCAELSIPGYQKHPLSLNKTCFLQMLQDKTVHSIQYSIMYLHIFSVTDPRKH